MRRSSSSKSPNRKSPRNPIISESPTNNLNDNHNHKSDRDENERMHRATKPSPRRIPSSPSSSATRRITRRMSKPQHDDDYSDDDNNNNTNNNQNNNHNKKETKSTKGKGSDSIMTRTRRTNRIVQPLGTIPKDSDDFEDVNAFWVASTSTDDPPNSNSNSNGEEQDSDDAQEKEEETSEDMATATATGENSDEKIARREAARQHKRELKRVHRAMSRDRYQRDVRGMPLPNFRLGSVPEQQYDEHDNHHDNDQDKNQEQDAFLTQPPPPPKTKSTTTSKRQPLGSWVEKTIRATATTQSTTGVPVRMPLLSPSELSRVSTIPPTPATASTFATAASGFATPATFASASSSSVKTGGDALSSVRGREGSSHDDDDGGGGDRQAAQKADSSDEEGGGEDEMGVMKNLVTHRSAAASPLVGKVQPIERGPLHKLNDSHGEDMDEGDGDSVADADVLQLDDDDDDDDRQHDPNLGHQQHSNDSLHTKHTSQEEVEEDDLFPISEDHDEHRHDDLFATTNTTTTSTTTPNSTKTSSSKGPRPASKRTTTTTTDDAKSNDHDPNNHNENDTFDYAAMLLPRDPNAVPTTGDGDKEQPPSSGPSINETDADVDVDVDVDATPQLEQSLKEVLDNTAEHIVQVETSDIAKSIQSDPDDADQNTNVSDGDDNNNEDFDESEQDTPPLEKSMEELLHNTTVDNGLEGAVAAATLLEVKRASHSLDRAKSSPVPTSTNEQDMDTVDMQYDGGGDDHRDDGSGSGDNDDFYVDDGDIDDDNEGVGFQLSVQDIQEDEDGAVANVGVGNHGGDDDDNGGDQHVYAADKDDDDEFDNSRVLQSRRDRRSSAGVVGNINEEQERAMHTSSRDNRIDRSDHDDDGKHPSTTRTPSSSGKKKRLSRTPGSSKIHHANASPGASSNRIFHDEFGNEIKAATSNSSDDQAHTPRSKEKEINSISDHSTIKSASTKVGTTPLPSSRKKKRVQLLNVGSSNDVENNYRNQAVESDEKPDANLSMRSRQSPTSSGKKKRRQSKDRDQVNERINDEEEEQHVINSSEASLRLPTSSGRKKKRQTEEMISSSDDNDVPVSEEFEEEDEPIISSSRDQKRTPSSSGKKNKSRSKDVMSTDDEAYPTNEQFEDEESEPIMNSSRVEKLTPKSAGKRGERGSSSKKSPKVKKTPVSLGKNRQKVSSRGKRILTSSAKRKRRQSKTAEFSENDGYSTSYDSEEEERKMYIDHVPASSIKKRRRSEQDSSDESFQSKETSDSEDSSSLVLERTPTPSVRTGQQSVDYSSDDIYEFSPENDNLEVSGETPMNTEEKRKRTKMIVSALRTSSDKKRVKGLRRRVRYATPPQQGFAVGNREYQPVPITDYKKDGSEIDGSLRRSKRVRIPPLAFWKNEHLSYEPHNEEGALGAAMGNMPVVTKVVKALPTPYKRRPIRRTVKDDSEKDGNSIKKKKTSRKIEQLTPFDSKKLRKKYKLKDGETAMIWDEAGRGIEEKKIISFNENMKGTELPLNGERQENESQVVGKASQAFNNHPNGILPGWIAGNLVLPPSGIKDAEGVGLCSQVFNIGDCQPGSLEFAIADPDEDDGKFEQDSAQRFMLSKGDMFHVPAGNIYRIENHSKSHECTLFWTIIRPMKPTQNMDEQMDEQEGN